MKVTLANINDVIDFDCVFEIRDGELTDRHDLLAPSTYHVEGAQHPNDVEIHGDGWSALHGYTGQWGYSGAVMHASEYIGGRLAEDLLEGGIFAVTTVEDLDDPEGPAGWCVLRFDPTVGE